MSRAHDLAWCAGFFDGEGYITISRRKIKRGEQVYTGHYLRIGINHVRIEPLLEMKRILGGSIRFDKNSDKHCKDGYTRIPRHIWLLSTQSAGDALRCMLPYFRNKQQEAEIAFNFLSTIQKTKQSIPDDITKLRESYKQALQSLNAIG